MTWWRRWRHHDRSDEARQRLRELDERHDEVERLAAAAREQLRRNHFSELVALAIARRSEGGSHG